MGRNTISSACRTGSGASPWMTFFRSTLTTVRVVRRCGPGAYLHTCPHILRPRPTPPPASGSAAHSAESGWPLVFECSQQIDHSNTGDNNRIAREDRDIRSATCSWVSPEIDHNRLRNAWTVDDDYMTCCLRQSARDGDYIEEPLTAGTGKTPCISPVIVTISLGDSIS